MFGPNRFEYDISCNYFKKQLNIANVCKNIYKICLGHSPFTDTAILKIKSIH